MDPFEFRWILSDPVVFFRIFLDPSVFSWISSDPGPLQILVDAFGSI